jgi:HSP20 family protein
MKALIKPRDMSSLRDEIDRFFNRVIEGADFGLLPEGDWLPALDLTETRDAVICRVDAPAMEPKDIHVTLNDGVLTIRGERKSEKEEKETTRYRLERKYGEFVRTLRLPGPVDGAKVTAQFKNGLLTITMPRLAGAAGQTEVPIRVD